MKVEPASIPGRTTPVQLFEAGPSTTFLDRTATRPSPESMERWIQAGDWITLEKNASRDGLFDILKKNGLLNSELLSLWRRLGGRDRDLVQVGTEAAEQGNVSTLRCYLQETKLGFMADIEPSRWTRGTDRAISERTSLLYLASYHGRPDAVRMLVETGAVDFCRYGTFHGDCRVIRPWFLGGETYGERDFLVTLSGLLEAVRCINYSKDRYEDYLEVIHLLTPVASTEQRAESLDQAIEFGLVGVARILCAGATFDRQQRTRFWNKAQRLGPRRLLQVLPPP